MKYMYETHCHTCESSKCAKVPGKELARVYKEMGYTGIFVSDHFLNGNTTVPRELPWEERIELYERGYREVKEEGDRIGLDVFFTWECSMSGDYLIVGLDKQWLLDNPDQLTWKPSVYCDKVHEAGGLVIHAHPFREAAYIEKICLMPRKCDGVEIYNAGRTPEENARAEWYAKEYGLIPSAGTDNHSGRRARFGGVYLPERIACTQDFVRLFREGKAEVFRHEYDENMNRIDTNE